MGKERKEEVKEIVLPPHLSHLSLEVLRTIDSYSQYAGITRGDLEEDSTIQPQEAENGKTD